jgi:hypothetical protein
MATISHRIPKILFLFPGKSEFLRNGELLRAAGNQHCRLLSRPETKMDRWWTSDLRIPVPFRHRTALYCQSLILRPHHRYLAGMGMASNFSMCTLEWMSVPVDPPNKGSAVQTRGKPPASPGQPSSSRLPHQNSAKTQTSVAPAHLPNTQVHICCQARDHFAHLLMGPPFQASANKRRNPAACSRATYAYPRNPTPYSRYLACGC